MTEEKLVTEHCQEKLVVPEVIFGRLLIRSGIAKTETEAVVQSAGIFVVLAFIPLLVLSLANKTAYGTAIEMPLAGDYITLTRYLLVAPILILSDVVTRPWITRVAERFQGIVYQEDSDAFKHLFNQIFHLRNSNATNIFVFLVALCLSLFGTSIVLAIDSSCWQLLNAGGSGIADLTPAGLWNAFVSQPLFRFVAVSWFVDYLLWVYFLYRVSRLKLKVIATHPDCVGGLSFVRVAQAQYCIAAFALSCAICSVIAQTVRYTHVSLQSFSNLGLVFIFITLLVFAGPLIVFTPKLVQTKLNGVFSYGALCHELSHLFADKWLVIKKKPGDGSILDSADPSALADLNGSFQTVATMQPIVVDQQFLIIYVVMACLPALPLIASVVPIQDIIKQIFDALT